MDISRLLNNTDAEPTASSSPLKPEPHTTNSHGNNNQRHLATSSLSRIPQSSPFRSLLPKQEWPLGAGVHSRIPQEPAKGRSGPCLLHPPYGTSRVKDKNPFSPAEDAAMIYLLENLGVSRRYLLSAIFGRTHGNINIRRDELYDYRYCRGCPSCHMVMQRLFNIKQQYQGARWTISQELSNGKVDVLVPPPRRIRSFENFPLPVIARVRGRSRKISLSVSSGGLSVQWDQRTLRSSSDYYHTFHSRPLRRTGSWTLLRLGPCLQRTSVPEK
ncbi:hypothetical protein BJY01DRAFT_121811 [Aspergillus pseudoustus]|uniref:Uncharacterized protein n=1 Tax=Aspergillus pseudoustus TaxID=1810923 RepID=A0ABR4IQ47_9EURO